MWLCHFDFGFSGTRVAIRLARLVHLWLCCFLIYHCREVPIFHTLAPSRVYLGVRIYTVVRVPQSVISFFSHVCQYLFLFKVSFADFHLFLRIPVLFSLSAISFYVDDWFSCWFGHTCLESHWTFGECSDQSPNFSERHFWDYDAYLDPFHFKARRMIGNSVFAWDFDFRRHRDTAVGACPMRWWRGASLCASVCHFVTPGVDTPFVQCFEELDYEKALGQLVAMRDLAM